MEGILVKWKIHKKERLLVNEVLFHRHTLIQTCVSYLLVFLAIVKIYCWIDLRLRQNMPNEPLINPGNASFRNDLRYEHYLFQPSRVGGSCIDKHKSLDISVIYICLYKKCHLFRKTFPDHLIIAPYVIL